MKHLQMNPIRSIMVSLLAFCSIGISAAHAQDRRVLLSNESSYTLVKFYASNVGTNEWEEDILHRGVLASGYYIDVNVDDGTGYCHFDFKAVFSNGEEVIRHNVDVCSTLSWTIYDRSNTLN